MYKTVDGATLFTADSYPPLYSSRVQILVFSLGWGALPRTGREEAQFRVPSNVDDNEQINKNLFVRKVLMG